ncbi:MerR family transcriptional regulator [Lishizhenia sp.]|uniref:MerR family transcriptional regulator n=1 Tax=Lishizhenia sp. TaxID=2497594 RepID=UPI00299EFBD3|nr:MerR family transcriptional regulator [Lishizhenia sp.]MDX1445701.1 MerR family transcriptional regulator [Lishizhenia sp.]
MKVNEANLKKLYYSIGEVAEMFEVNTSLIRFWEKEFTVIKPKKNKKGNRLFTPKDISNFNKIYHLVKEQGHTLDGARKAIKEKESVYSEKDLVIDKLESIKTALIKLKEGK